MSQKDALDELADLGQAMDAELERALPVERKKAERGTGDAKQERTHVADVQRRTS